MTQRKRKSEVLETKDGYFLNLDPLVELACGRRGSYSERRAVAFVLREIAARTSRGTLLAEVNRLMKERCVRA